jgi:hypothetical protein
MASEIDNNDGIRKNENVWFGFIRRFLNNKIKNILKVFCRWIWFY